MKLSVTGLLVTCSVSGRVMSPEFEITNLSWVEYCWKGYDEAFPEKKWGGNFLMNVTRLWYEKSTFNRPSKTENTSANFLIIFDFWCDFWTKVWRILLHCQRLFFRFTRASFGRQHKLLTIKWIWRLYVYVRGKEGLASRKNLLKSVYFKFMKNWLIQLTLRRPNNFFW